MANEKEFNLGRFASHVFKQLCKYDLKEESQEPQRVWTRYNWLLKEETPLSRELNFPVEGFNGDVSQRMQDVRQNFQKKWQKAVDKTDLVDLVVKKWAGINISSEDTWERLSNPKNNLDILEKYVACTASLTIVLSFAYPEEYCIYDERVAFSLIYFWNQWEEKDEGTRCPFILPPGQSTKIKEFIKDAQITSVDAKSYLEKKVDFYNDIYLAVLDELVKKYIDDDDTQTNKVLFRHNIEMALFALKDKLLEEADYCSKRSKEFSK